MKLIDAEEYALLQNELVERPERGALIPGTGGVRKHRFSRAGRGRSGGIRVIYYVVTSRGTIYLLDVYAKNDKADLTQQERNDLRKLVRRLEQ